MYKITGAFWLLSLKKVANCLWGKFSMWSHLYCVPWRCSHKGQDLDQEISLAKSSPSPSVSKQALFVCLSEGRTY